jgi:glycosidase
MKATSTLVILAWLLISVLLGRWARAQVSTLGPSPDLRDHVLYQIMPMTWRQSDPASKTPENQGLGDLKGLKEGLGYLKEMGFTGYWITPPFPSAAYHGYQHDRADLINPRLGTESDFLDLIRTSHANSLKVFCDLVVYGISTDSEYFKDAYHNPASKYSTWLAFKDKENKTYQGYTFTTWDGSKLGICWWDLRQPEPRDLVIGWSTKWLDPNGDGDPSDGLDGYRLDHVWSKYNPSGVKTPDGWGYNLDTFWMPWKAALRKVNPKVVTFAEQARWETTGADLLGPFDAAFTKPLEFAMRDGLRDQLAAPIYASVERTLQELGGEMSPDGFRPNISPTGRTFLGIIGDHDVDRLASALNVDPSTAPFQNLVKARCAAALHLLSPFPPIVYAGDEIAMLGKAGKFGTDANDIPRREPFKWMAVAGAPMSDYWARSPEVKAAAYSKDNDGRSVEEQLGRPGWPLEAYRELIRIRLANRALTHGAYKPVSVSEPGTWCFLRRSEATTGAQGETIPGQLLLVAINMVGKPLDIRADLSELVQGDETYDVLSLELMNFANPLPPSPLNSTNKSAFNLSIADYGIGIFRIQPAAQSPAP